MEKNQHEKYHGGTSGRAVAEIIYQTASSHFSVELLCLENGVYRSQPQAVGIEYVGIPHT
jgi:hypothetical protein